MKHTFRCTLLNNLVQVEISEVNPPINIKELEDDSYLIEKIVEVMECGYRNGHFTEEEWEIDKKESSTSQTVSFVVNWHIIPEIFRIIDWQKNHLPEETLTLELMVGTLGQDRVDKFEDEWDYVSDGDIITFFLIADLNPHEALQIHEAIWNLINKYEERIDKEQGFSSSL